MVNLPMHNHFSRTYQQAREHFLALCQTSEAVLVHIKHPDQGPDGELYADVASWCDPNCDHLIVVSSATHGIEGYAGSGLQSLLLADDVHRQLPKGTGLLMIHAVNPYGFAWQRRVDELNIDLNRNFVDHDQLPVNEAYREIATLLEPIGWDESVEQAIQQKFQTLNQEKGAGWLQAAMTMGQYEFSDGFFYGGDQPAWSNRLMYRLADEYFAKAKSVTMIDIHTALGEFGEAECITTYAPESDESRRCRALWGDRVKSTGSGESRSVDVNGPMVNAMQGYSDFLGTGLEFGTRGIPEVTMALVADQWLHRYGDFDMSNGTYKGGGNRHPIKDRMMDAFYPDSAKWRDSMADITREVLAQSLTRSP